MRDDLAAAEQPSPAEIVDDDPAAPWNDPTNPVAGMKSATNRRLSWEASQRRKAEFSIIDGGQGDEPPQDDWQPPAEIPKTDATPAIEPPPPAKSFTPVAIDDVTLSAEPAWAIHRLLPARGLACIVGPPKSGKSFLASDALFSIARGVPYAGRAVLQGGVFYLTGEGVSGFKRRMIALRRHHGVEGQGVPFFMIEEVPDLGSETTDAHQLIAVLDRFIADRGLPPPRAIALDTLARCMGRPYGRRWLAGYDWRDASVDRLVIAGAFADHWLTLSDCIRRST
jgi:hypothetical protein